MEARVWKSESASLSYLFWEPQDRRPGEKLPMIVFLHGAGERGPTVHQMECHALPRIFSKANPYRCIVVCPWCPGEDYWSLHLQETAQFIREMIVLYDADPDRVSLTGLSMGGYGTWELSTTYPELFSAIAPVCGGGTNWRAYRLVKTSGYSVPVWAFHGLADSVVPWQCDQIMVDAVNNHGGNARITLYPDIDHDSWTPAYEESAMISWLLAQKRA